MVGKWYIPTVGQDTNGFPAIGRQGNIAGWSEVTRMPYMILDAKGRGTLPEEVRAALSLEGGDLVLLEQTDHGTYELVPASIIPKDQLWFHHPDVRARVTEAEADFAAGRVTSASSPEEAQRVLDSFKGSQPVGGVARKKAR